MEILSDTIIPFQLESSGLRGRIVRLGPVLDQILGAHGYPVAVNQLVGETVTLTTLLSSMLKYEGIFTLQTSGDGPVKMLVSDMTSAGQVRGYAGFDADRLKHVVDQFSAFSSDIDGGSDNQLAQLLGKGYIAFTVDQGDSAERYQGIVELKGASLTECVQHYFVQSEQIATGIRMVVGQGPDGNWQAQGMMLQQMPEDRRNIKPGHQDEDDWRRAMILMQSASEAELLNPDLTPYDILNRLFHEEGVRVYDAHGVFKGCRCSMERVEAVLSMMSAEDRADMVVDDKITMTCEFCNQDYVLDPALISKAKPA